MKLTIPFLSVFFVSFLAYGQTKTITGKIIDEFDLEAVPAVRVYTSDRSKFVEADINGSFKMEVPAGTDQLSLTFVGYEETLIQLSSKCNKLEIIMFSRVTYDFIALDKINRLRYRRFKKLKNKHLEAYQKGIFTSPTPCFEYIFTKH